MIQQLLMSIDPYKLPILELICLFYWFTKAMHDSSVTDIQDYNDPSYKNASSAWHSWASVGFGLMVLGIVLAGGHLLWSIPLCLSGVFFAPIFQAVRNEKKGIFYIGDKGWDGVMKKYLGKNAGLWQFIIGVLAFIVSTTITIKFGL
jgi:hypothetical protein